MGKKAQKHDWREAKHLCRLNQNDIAMAKALGFRPDSLIRARPDPKQKWKLPVKYWIRDLHSERFGYVLGEKELPAPRPSTLEDNFEYGFEYERSPASDFAYRGETPAKSAPLTYDISDDDVPF